MDFFTFLMGGNMFYSLGELQLLVFHPEIRSSGRGITIFVHFGRFSSNFALVGVFLEGYLEGIGWVDQGFLSNLMNFGMF